jgi:hypothetical protein
MKLCVCFVCCCDVIAVIRGRRSAPPKPVWVHEGCAVYSPEVCMYALILFNCVHILVFGIFVGIPLVVSFVLTCSSDCKVIYCACAQQDRHYYTLLTLVAVSTQCELCVSCKAGWLHLSAHSRLHAVVPCASLANVLCAMCDCATSAALHIMCSPAWRIVCSCFIGEAVDTAVRCWWSHL